MSNFSHLYATLLEITTVMIQMDFLSTLKQLQLMLFEMFYRRLIYPVVSSIFHRTCGSISNVLDYNIYMNEPQFGLQLRMSATLVIIPRRPPLFPIVYGTCSIEPLKSFHKQIIISRFGIIVFRCSTERKTQCSSKNTSKPNRTCTGTTKTQIR